MVQGQLGQLNYVISNVKFYLLLNKNSRKTFISIAGFSESNPIQLRMLWQQILISTQLEKTDKSAVSSAPFEPCRIPKQKTAKYRLN